jgi:predicted  nucleic acid-binding Zn-ribbon protein
MRKSALDLAIDRLTAERDSIDLAIKKLQAQQAEARRAIARVVTPKLDLDQKGGAS